MAAACLVPSYPHYESSLTTRLFPSIRYGLLDTAGALDWIRKNTPKTSYHLSPNQQPEYGILANWNLGAFIYQVAERPALATAFGSETHGLYEQTGFMSTSHPEIAATILRENKIRYVLLKAIKSVQDDFSIAAYGEKTGKIPVGTTDVFRPELSMYNRLMYYDSASYALEEGTVPAVGNYRLVFETGLRTEIRNPPMIVSWYKVFEVVPGARITGRTRPGAEVSVNLRLVTNAGRTMYFTDRTRSDREGRYDFRVPYSTETAQGDTRPVGQYGISGNGPGGIRVPVTEAEVIGGLTINLSDRKKH
jgi:asparagine N-glycosylation enzyme membrane subunit Stt3